MLKAPFRPMMQDHGIDTRDLPGQDNPSRLATRPPPGILIFKQLPDREWTWLQTAGDFRYVVSDSKDKDSDVL
jgi:hypothetical protein